LERGTEALQLGALRLRLPSSLLERRPKALQLGSLFLCLLGLLLRCRPLDVPLTSNPRQLLLQRPLTRSQIGHFGVGVDVFEHQLGVVLPELAHLGVQPVHLDALLARDFPQLLQRGTAWVKTREKLKPIRSNFRGEILTWLTW